MRNAANPLRSIRERLSYSANCSRRFLCGTSRVSIVEVACGTSLGGRLEELSGRSILLTTRDQLAAALALIELDGVASRIIICPPEIISEQLPFVIAKGGVDAIVTDYEVNDHECLSSLLRVTCRAALTPSNVEQLEHRPTEWVLLTSGTTGMPKMVVHSLATLAAAIDTTHNHTDGQGTGAVWGTFYDIRRYGGLQVFLRALLGDGSLVLSSTAEPVADHLERLGARGVTHLSGTPSQWRRALMSPHARAIAPQYVRLSGEIADQAILNSLRSFYPKAAIGHAFASTEAGVAFEVNDCLAGFPAAALGKRGDVEMRIRNDSLQIRSNRVALRYLDGENGVADEQGFVDTGDMVELCGDRCYFLGRRNGVINVGGLKVYPEEVEAVINRHPAVRMSMVWSQKNPITGALVSAEIVLKQAPDSGITAEQIADLRREVLEMCRQSLPPHKIPATIRCVSALEVATAGKLVRQRA